MYITLNYIMYITLIMTEIPKTNVGKQNDPFQNRTEWDLMDKSLLLEDT